MNHFTACAELKGRKGQNTKLACVSHQIYVGCRMAARNRFIKSTRARAQRQAHTMQNIRVHHLPTHTQKTPNITE